MQRMPVVDPIQEITIREKVQQVKIQLNDDITVSRLTIICRKLKKTALFSEVNRNRHAITAKLEMHIDTAKAFDVILEIINDVLSRMPAMKRLASKRTHRTALLTQDGMVSIDISHQRYRNDPPTARRR